MLLWASWFHTGCSTWGGDVAPYNLVELSAVHWKLNFQGVLVDGLGSTYNLKRASVWIGEGNWALRYVWQIRSSLARAPLLIWAFNIYIPFAFKSHGQPVQGSCQLLFILCCQIRKYLLEIEQRDGSAERRASLLICCLLFLSAGVSVGLQFSLFRSAACESENLSWVYVNTLR